MSIQKQCVLRYRTEGHVRFEMPATLCRAEISEKLQTKISKIEGVYRVNFYVRQKKISIRFQETVCEFDQLIKQLFDLISELETDFSIINSSERGILESISEKIHSKVENLKVTRWIKEKTLETKETIQAAKIITKLGLKKPATALIKNPEKAIIDFLNDILVLFLIRLHWEHITKLWLLNPFKYRHEWLATFYMFFLLIRSRKPK